MIVFILVNDDVPPYLQTLVLALHVVVHFQQDLRLEFQRVFILNNDLLRVEVKLYFLVLLENRQEVAQNRLNHNDQTRRI